MTCNTGFNLYENFAYNLQKNSKVIPCSYMEILRVAKNSYTSIFVLLFDF